MTPVHPIETSGGARRSRDRQQTGWRRPAAFQVPDRESRDTNRPVAAAQPPQSLGMVTVSAESGLDVAQSSHTFVDNVTRVMRSPPSIAGLFVDLTV